MIDIGNHCVKCGAEIEYNSDLKYSISGWIHVSNNDYVLCGFPALPDLNESLAELDEIDRILQ